MVIFMYYYNQKINKRWNGKTTKAQNRKCMAESKECWWLKGRKGQEMIVWRAGIPRKHPLRRTWHPADAHEAAGAHDFSTVTQEEERHVQWEMRPKEKQAEFTRDRQRKRADHRSAAPCAEILVLVHVTNYDEPWFTLAITAHFLFPGGAAAHGRSIKMHLQLAYKALE